MRTPSSLDVGVIATFRNFLVVSLQRMGFIHFDITGIQLSAQQVGKFAQIILGIGRRNPVPGLELHIGQRGDEHAGAALDFLDLEFAIAAINGVRQLQAGSFAGLSQSNLGGVEPLTVDCSGTLGDRAAVEARSTTGRAPQPGRQCWRAARNRICGIRPLPYRLPRPQPAGWLRCRWSWPCHRQY